MNAVWRSIESAPLNQTTNHKVRILVYDPNHGTQIAYHFKGNWWVVAKHYHVPFLELNPTHWMPLPNKLEGE